MLSGDVDCRNLGLNGSAAAEFIEDRTVEQVDAGAGFGVRLSLGEGDTFDEGVVRVKKRELQVGTVAADAAEGLD